MPVRNTCSEPASSFTRVPRKPGRRPLRRPHRSYRCRRRRNRIPARAASVSPDTNSRCASTAATTSAGASRRTSTRSVTSRPASLRACCTTRTTSRATPSASSAGVTSVSRTTTPAPDDNVGGAFGGARSQRQLILAVLQNDVGGGDSVGVGGPIARLDRFNDSLNVLSERGPRTLGTRVSV